MNALRTIIFAMLVVSWILNAQFETLEEVQAYAHTYAEDIRSDNDDIRYPNFKSAYSTQKPGFFEKIKNFFGITTTKPQWNALAFKNLLEYMTQQRSLLTFSKNNEQTIKVPVDGQCVSYKVR